MTMNPVVKVDWLAALRSDDYAQGRGHLHEVVTDVDGPPIHAFCCLGVLCDLAVRAGIAVTQKTDDDDGGYLVTYGVERYSVVLPPEVRDWAGLTSDDPVVAGRELSAWNDGSSLVGRGPVGFDRIADLIEVHL